MVALGRRVRVNYKGYLDDGTVFDSTEQNGGQPLEFLVGRRQVVPGFDKAVSEMELGEKRTVHIPAEMAYGEYDEELIEAVPCDIFPNWEQLPIGRYIVLRTVEGPLRLKVLKVEDGKVFLDKNHELAGRDLNFDIELIYIHGESGDLIEQERESGCACGCDILKEAIDPLRKHAHGECGCQDHAHDHGHDHAHAHRAAEGCC